MKDSILPMAPEANCRLTTPASKASTCLEFGDRDGGAVGVDLDDLIAGEPAREIEIVRGGIVEQRAVGLHLAGARG